MASTPIGKAVSVEVLRDDQRVIFLVKTEELKEEEETPAGEVCPYLGMQVQEITPEMVKNYGSFSNRSGWHDDICDT